MYDVMSPLSYIDKIVSVDAETKGGTPEKLLVRVEGVIESKGDTLLHGTVLVQPTKATYLKVGDRVEFTLDEIEEITQ